MRYVSITILILIVIGGYLFLNKKEVPVVYEPYSIWCDGEWQYFSPGETECMSITRGGHKIASTTITTDLKFFGSIPENFAAISSIVDEINTRFKVNAVYIRENGEPVLYSVLGMIFLPRGDLQNSLINMTTFLEDKQNKEFEYIDLRHGNSVFFKEK